MLINVIPISVYDHTEIFTTCANQFQNTGKGNAGLFEGTKPAKAIKIVDNIIVNYPQKISCKTTKLFNLSHIILRLMIVFTTPFVYL